MRFLKFLPLVILMLVLPLTGTTAAPRSHLSTSPLIIEPDQGRAPLLTAIQHAQHDIHLVMYLFTDQAMLRALKTARKRGIHVTVLIQHHPYKARFVNEPAIKQLKAMGAKVIYANPYFALTHQKTLVIDQRLAIIMTFNFNFLSFKNRRNFAVLDRKQSDVRQILAVFAADAARQQIKLKPSSLVYSPDNSRRKLLYLIKHAKHSLDIMALELGDYQIIGELGHAVKHGVKVQVLINKSRDGELSRKLNFLRQKGVIIHAPRMYNHAKVLIADNSRAYIGSANLSQISLDKNRELGIMTRQQNVLKPLLATWQHDWQRSRPF